MVNAAMDISSTSEGGSAVGTSNLIGREMDKENRKRSSLQVGPSIPVEANTPTKDKIKVTRKGRRVSFAESIEEIPSPSWQAQPSHPGYSQDKRTEEPYAPKSHDRSPARVPAAPFNHGSLYPSHIPLSPASRDDQSIVASTSALPFSYPITDTLMQTQSQQHHLLTQHSPVHAPAPTPAGYFTPYQDYQPAPQSYASRSHPYTGPLYSVYNSQQPPHAAPVPNELHQGRGVASQRQTGQIATPFPPMAPYHAPYVQPPSRKVDSFVANDPWRPNIHRKHPKDVETFDEVPLLSASQPPWMPHEYQPRMASPQVPHPVSAVTPPAYRPPTVACRKASSVNPNPVVTPELPPPNGSSPRRRTSPAVPGSAAPLEPLRDPHPPRESEGSASPPHSFTTPSSGRRRSHSRSPDGSLRSEGLERETSSPVADPLSFPGHDGKNDSVLQPDMPPASPITSEWPTKHSNTSWSTESIGYPSYKPTTPPIPTKTLLRRLANLFKKAFTFAAAFQFILATLLSQVYLSILLRLPSLYFSRVARIFEEADLTLPELKKMALETASQARGQVDLHAFQSESNKVPQYDRLRSTWESFIDSIMREWKTFNIISVLLLSAILTILQIESAVDDPVIRYAALLSMICALVSLLFGCMYIIRFGSMRKTYKAAEWALVSGSTASICRTYRGS
ncbi:hypothetical protein CPC08DRAFT_220158 [Agrocybe pediades]|nr:hypothetical protein CPC08DRAFT_220158 [Agrocybe pediades]